MDKKVKDLHEKITDVYNTMWVAYKKYLEDADQLRKIYFPIAESWKLIREFCDATGTPVECFKVHERAQDIYERSDKTQFATEIVSATVNLIDRLMRENGGTAKEWRK